MKHTLLMCATCKGRGQVISIEEPYFQTDAWCVECGKCGKTTNYYGDKGLAIATWNNQNNLPHSLHEKLLKLKEFLIENNMDMFIEENGSECFPSNELVIKVDSIELGFDVSCDSLIHDLTLFEMSNSINK